MTNELKRLKDELKKISKPWPKYGTDKHNRVMELRKEIRRVEMKELDGDGILYYDSNNSGGGWWLKDEDWQALEDAGWTVHWCIQTNEYGTPSFQGGRVYSDSPLDKLKRPEVGPTEGWKKTYEILLVPQSYDEAVENGARWLGGLAMSCAKAGEDPNELVREWERITGQNAADQGCNCCGPPHSFEWIGPDGEEKRPEVEIIESFKGF
jgi:hypothetical protein